VSAFSTVIWLPSVRHVALSLETTLRSPTHDTDMSAVPTLPRTGAVARTAANAMPATASTASSTATMVARRRPFLGARWDAAVARCIINLLPLRLEKLGNGLRRSRACQVGPGGSAAGLWQPQALQMG